MLKLLGVFITILFIAGCASTSGVGRLAVVESKAYKKIGEEYDKGAKETAAGEKLITKGRKMSESGRKLIRKGETVVENGNQTIKRNRERYSSATNYVNTPDDPYEIQTDTSELVNIGKEWKKGIEEVKKGNNMIADGTQKINEGQSLIREGRSQIEFGKSLMREAERAYNTQKTEFKNYND